MPKKITKNPTKYKTKQDKNPEHWSLNKETPVCPCDEVTHEEEEWHQQSQYGRQRTA